MMCADGLGCSPACGDAVALERDIFADRRLACTLLRNLDWRDQRRSRPERCNPSNVVQGS